MEFTDKTELITALVKAKSEFGEIKKTKTNPFFKSKYADLEDVNNAVDAALTANGLIMIQPVISVDDRLYVETYLVHTSGQHIESRWEVVLSNDGKRSRQQGEGAGVTYIRRYAKVAMLGLASETDDDGNATGQQGGQKGRQRQPAQSGGKSDKAGEGDRKACFAIASEMGWNENEIADFFRSHCPVVNKDGGDLMFKKVKSRKQFTPENWRLLRPYLKDMLNKKKDAATGNDSPDTHKDGLMGESLISDICSLLDAGEISLVRWLETNYIVDTEDIPADKEAAIRAFLIKLDGGDPKLVAKAAADIVKATKWYNGIGAEAADVMVHTLAKQDQEVIDLFKEKMGIKTLRGITKETFANWNLALKQSKSEAGEPDGDTDDIPC